ncbi:hypothetical protein TURU_151200 [Turdus rufiventris]|nr:hypothetical protein TURU_151200 [Turdus rufiventris]
MGMLPAKAGLIRDDSNPSVIITHLRRKSKQSGHIVFLPVSEDEEVRTCEGNNLCPAVAGKDPGTHQTITVVDCDLRVTICVLPMAMALTSSIKWNMQQHWYEPVVLMVCPGLGLLLLRLLLLFGNIKLSDFPELNYVQKHNIVFNVSSSSTVAVLM